MKFLLLLLLQVSAGFAFTPVSQRLAATRLSLSTPGTSDAWTGEVVPDAGGKIRGCTLQAVGEDPVVEWIITIDGIEADLGKFSQAIYKKISSDAKKQRFQGFRPGTIPPHLEPTYRAFTMDECARETVLEAMAQNNIRAFTDARNDFVIENVSIPPPPKKASSRRKKGGRKERARLEAEAQKDAAEEDGSPQWLSFENMKGAIDAGWKVRSLEDILGVVFRTMNAKELLAKTT